MAFFVCLGLGKKPKPGFEIVYFSCSCWKPSWMKWKWGYVWQRGNGGLPLSHNACRQSRSSDVLRHLIHFTKHQPSTFYASLPLLYDQCLLMPTKWAFRALGSLSSRSRKSYRQTIWLLWSTCLEIHWQRGKLKGYTAPQIYLFCLNKEMNWEETIAVFSRIFSQRSSDWILLENWRISTESSLQLMIVLNTTGSRISDIDL